MDVIKDKILSLKLQICGPSSIIIYLFVANCFYFYFWETMLCWAYISTNKLFHISTNLYF